MPELTIGVTGANGYVGRLVVAAVGDAGGRAVTFSSSARAGQRPYRLGDPMPIEAVADLTAVVHAAHDFTSSAAETHDRNTAGSVPLLDAAAAAGVPVVLISTLAAFDGCRSGYGRGKLALERLVFERGGRVLRAGLVTGPGAGGIVGTLTRWVAALPIVPVLAPHSAAYVTDGATLGRLVVHLSRGEDTTGTSRPILAAADEPLTFLSLVRTLAAADGSRAPTVQLPTLLGLAALRAGEALRLPLPFRSDGLLALAHPVPADQVAVLDRSPIPFPPFCGPGLTTAVRGADQT